MTTKPEIIRCPTCKRPQKRSTNANARYWALLHEIATHIRPNGQSYSAEVWHCYFKSRYLGCDDVRLPNGRTLAIPHSSANLDTAEFNEYMTRVEVWASDHGVFLADLAA